MLDASAGSRPANSTRLAVDIGSVAKGYIHADLSGERCHGSGLATKPCDRLIASGTELR